MTAPALDPLTYWGLGIFLTAVVMAVVCIALAPGVLKVRDRIDADVLAQTATDFREVEVPDALADQIGRFEEAELRQTPIFAELVREVSR